MMLFERILSIVEKTTKSQAKFAESIDIHPRTMNNWMNEKSQDNFWPVLPKILEVYPRISRQWLYFEEGPMFIGHGVPLDQPVPLQEVQAALEQMAKDATCMNKVIFSLAAGQPLPIALDAEEKIRLLEAELYEERKLNRQLTSKLLLEEKQGTCCQESLKVVNEQP